MAAGPLRGLFLQGRTHARSEASHTEEAAAHAGSHWLPVTSHNTSCSRTPPTFETASALRNGNERREKKIIRIDGSGGGGGRSHKLKQPQLEMAGGDGSAAGGWASSERIPPRAPSDNEWELAIKDTLVCTALYTRRANSSHILVLICR